MGKIYMQLLNRFNKDFTFLFLIFLVAFIIRLIGIDYGLPFNNFQPDEPKMILPATHVAVNFVNTKDFSKLEQPEYKYPHGAMNIFSGVFVIIYYFTRVIDKIYHIAPGVFSTFNNSTFTLFARVITAFFGSLLCLIVSFIGKEIKLNRSVCFGWALLVAVNFGLSVDSKYATRSMVSIFLAYLGLYLLLKFLNYTKLLYLILASFFYRIFCSSKFREDFFCFTCSINYLFYFKKRLVKVYKIRNYCSYLFCCWNAYYITLYFYKS